MDAPVAQYVLDSFACLAYVGREPGAGAVGRVLRGAERGEAVLWMSWVNAGEVYYMTGKRRGSEAAERVLQWLVSLPVALVHADRDACLSAAQLKASHRASYADCFCAALAIEKKAKVVTGDPEFAHLSPEVEIEWLPRDEAPATGEEG
jgi:ribonuclease VapC